MAAENNETLSLSLIIIVGIALFDSSDEADDDIMRMGVLKQEHEVIAKVVGYTEFIVPKFDDSTFKSHFRKTFELLLNQKN